jgi:hypothetical protein
MFKGRSSEQVAAEIRTAQERLREAEDVARRFTQEHTERIGAALAAGEDVADVSSVAREIAGARLRADALRVAVGRFHDKLRAAIESEDAKAREAAQAKIAACEKADAKLKEELAELATRAFGLAVQREGRQRGPLIAMRILNGFGLGDYGPTMSGWAALKASDSEAAKRMLAAVESSGGLPDYAADRKAAQDVLGRPLNIEARLLELLPPTAVEQAPAAKPNADPAAAHSPGGQFWSSPNSNAAVTAAAREAAQTDLT